MGSLTDEARIVLEKNIDNILKKPEAAEEIYSIVLREHGIEPNLETVLSFITGFLTGIMQHFYIVAYNRSLNPNEIKTLIALMKRKAFEMRMAFLETRIKE